MSAAGLAVAHREQREPLPADRTEAGLLEIGHKPSMQPMGRAWAAEDYMVQQAARAVGKVDCIEAAEEDHMHCQDIAADQASVTTRHIQALLAAVGSLNSLDHIRHRLKLGSPVEGQSKEDGRHSLEY